MTPTNLKEPLIKDRDAMPMLCSWTLALVMLGPIVPQQLEPTITTEEVRSSLFRLVPSDTAMVVTLEQMRRARQSIERSELWNELVRPVFWDGPAVSEFRKNLNEIERVLESDLVTVLDYVFGDCVVLSLHVLDDLDESVPSRTNARGLMLTTIRDPDLVKDLLRRINQLDDQLVQPVEEEIYRGVRYVVRRFQPESGRPPEWYTVLDRQILVWTNSEFLLRRVIDLNTRRRGSSLQTVRDPVIRVQAEPTSLADLDGFTRFRGFVSDAPWATLFISGEVMPRLLDLPVPNAADNTFEPLVIGMLRSIRWIGVSLESGEVLQIQAIQQFDLDAMPRPLAAFFAALRVPVGSDDDFERVPATRAGLPDRPSVVLGLRLDLKTLAEGFRDWFADADPDQVANLLTMLRGLSLDRDPFKDVLGGLGPQIVAYLDGDLFAPDWVLALENSEDPELEAALVNLTRTALALVAVVQKIPGRVDQGVVDDTQLLALDVPDEPLFISIGKGQVVASNAISPIRSHRQRARQPVDAPIDSMFEVIRRREFAEAVAYVYLDLERLQPWIQLVAGSTAESIGNPLTPAQRTQLNDAFQVLRAAYLTIDLDAETGIARQRFVLARETTESGD